MATQTRHSPLQDSTLLARKLAECPGVRVLPDFSSGALVVHAVFPSRRYLSTRVRTLDAALTAVFTARAARCEAWLRSATSPNAE